MKKFISMLLCVALLMSLNMSQVFAAADNKLDEKVKTNIISVVKQYFTDFYNVMLEDSTEDFSSSDFESVNGYITGKQMVFTRETYKELLAGIQSVTIEDIEINDITELDDAIEAMVYVKCSYSYNDDSETCNMGKLFRVTLRETDNGLLVVDLNDSSVETQMIKDELALNNTVNYDAVDKIFERKVEDLQDMRTDVINENLETETDAETETETETETDAGIESVSVSYKAATARGYAYKLGDNYENYIFKRAS